MAGGIRVLYVDDEPGLLELGRICLARSGGLRVDTSTSARTALDTLSISSYDVIISDYQMPGMDGIAFLKAIRERFGDLPFILFTGRGREEVVIDAINNGADFYIQKGGDTKAQFAELAHKVRQAVRRREAECSLQDSERRLSDIIDFLPDATFAIDSNGEVIAWNRAIEEMTGVPAVEMLGKGDREYAVPFHGSKRPMLIDLLDEPEEEISRLYSHAHRTGNTLAGETVLPCPKGRRMTVLVTACPLYNQAGEIAGGIESIRDITARNRLETDLVEKHAELQVSYEQLAAAKEKLRGNFEELACSEQRTRINEERLVMAQETGHIGSWEYNPGADEIWGSSVGLSLFGFTGEAGLVPLSHLEACIRERERVHQALVDLVAEGREYNLEYIVDPADGTAPRTIHSVARLEKDADGRPARVVGVVQDITERKKADAALQRVSTELQQIFGNMINGLIVCESVFDQTGRYVGFRFGQFNDAFARMTKVRYEDVCGKDVFEVWPETEQSWVEELGRVATSGIPSVFDMFHGPTGGWYHCNAYRPTSSPSQVCVIFEDITEQRRIEEETAFKNTILLTQQETSLDGILIVGDDGRVHHNNRRFIELWGIPEELEASRNDDLLLRYATGRLADPDAFLSRIRYLSAHRDEKSFEEHLLKDGRIFEVFSAPMLGVQGRYYGRVLYFRDITARRRMEDSLRESELRFRSLTQNSSDMCRIIDRRGLIAYSSPSTLRLFGYDPDDLIGEDPLEYVHPDDRERVKRELGDVFRGTQSGAPTEYRIRHADGQYIDVEALASNLLDTPGVDGIVTTIRPITERKKAEKELHESEKTFRSIFENSPYPIAINSVPDYSFLDVNRAFLDVSGYAEDEVLGKNPIELGLLSRTEALKLISRRVLAGKIENVPLALTAKGGRRVHVLFSTMSVTIGTGPAIMTVTSEVTKLKRVEEDLLRTNEDLVVANEELRLNYEELRKKEEMIRASEEKFRALVELSLDGTFIADFEGTLLFANRTAGLMVDVLDYQSLVGTRNVMEFVAPESQADVLRDFDSVSQGTDTYIAHYKLVTETKREIWVESIGKKIPFQGTVCTLVSMRDVTERKLAEERVRESELKFATVFRSSPVALTLVSAGDGTFVDVNDAFVRSTGYSRDDVIGRTSESVGIFADRSEYERFVSALRGGRTVLRMELKCRTRSGEIRTCLFASGIVPMGGTPHALSSIEDITERKATESALQAVVRSMVGETGLNALQTITETVSSWLGADCVMIGEIRPDGRTVNVLAMLLDGAEVTGYSYTLEGTPCENVAETGYCLYPDDAVRLFPASRDLVKLNIRGYVGTPLRNSGGDVIGILCALSRGPLAPPPTAQEILDIIAVKAAAEIERAQMERAVRESRHLLAEAVDLANLANWEFDVEAGMFTFDDRFYALYGTTVDQDIRREPGYHRTQDRRRGVAAGQ